MINHNKKIKVLQFTIAATKGGRTQYILNVWNHIDKTKFVFDFITFSEHLDFEEEIIQSGGRVFYISVHPEEDKEKFIKEFCTVLDNRYDVIEIHTSYWVSTIVEQLAIKARIPKIIIHSHSAGISKTLSKDERERVEKRHYEIRRQLTNDTATDFWACSREAAEWLFADKISQKKIEIFHNTIDTKNYRYNPRKRSAMRRKLMLENKQVIGFTGRLEKVKNVEFLIDVFVRVHSENGNTVLLLVGDGTLRRELERKCVEAGLELGKDVMFTGLVDNVSDYLQVMVVFALPSFFEGFSIVTLEAQCTGLKCVVSNHVPTVIEITSLVKRLPLEHNLWQSEMMASLSGYERTNRSEELKEKGFDTERFIKKLEMKYADRS